MDPGEPDPHNKPGRLAGVGAARAPKITPAPPTPDQEHRLPDGPSPRGSNIVPRAT
jgi:hypothetical protein